MGFLIDTSILIEAERGRIDLTPHIRDRPDEPFYLSVISASELLHGVHRARTTAQRWKRSAFVEAILDRFPLLDVDLASARAHARIWSTLAASGNLVGPHDMWLAATCVAYGLTLVTANTREFEQVPGLMVEKWT